MADKRPLIISAGRKQELTDSDRLRANSAILTTSINVPRIDNLVTDGAIMTTVVNGTLEVEEKANASFELSLFYSTY